MTKRLSEIGIVGEFYRRLDPPMDMQILSVSDLRPGEKHYEAVIVINEDQRRELVREAFKAGARYAAAMVMCANTCPPNEDEFLEEQGL